MKPVAMFEIGDEVDLLVAEARRLRGRYPTLPVVPLIYRMEDRRLNQLNEQWIQFDVTGGDEPRRSSELTAP